MYEFSCIVKANLDKIEPVPIRTNRQKPLAQTSPEPLERSITSLVEVLKRDLQKKFGHLDYEQLRKEGYSEILLNRLQQADMQTAAASKRASARSR
jgi:hypothetical protein